MLRRLRAFPRDLSGASSIEYALLAFAIFLVIIAGATTMGTKTAAYFNYLGSSLR